MDADTGYTLLASAITALATQLGIYSRLMARCDAMEQSIKDHILGCRGPIGAAEKEEEE